MPFVLSPIIVLYIRAYEKATPMLVGTLELILVCQEPQAHQKSRLQSGCKFLCEWLSNIWRIGGLSTVGFPVYGGVYVGILFSVCRRGTMYCSWETAKSGSSNYMASILQIPTTRTLLVPLIGVTWPLLMG